MIIIIHQRVESYNPDKVPDPFHELSFLAAMLLAKDTIISEIKSTIDKFTGNFITQRLKSNAVLESENSIKRDLNNLIYTIDRSGSLDEVKLLLESMKNVYAENHVCTDCNENHSVW